VHAKPAFAPFHLHQGDVGTVRFGIKKEGVPLAEGSTDRVLPGEPNMVALHHQRSPGERLGEGPVNATAGLKALEFGPQLAFDFWIYVELVRDPGERAGDVPQQIGINGSMRIFESVSGLVVGDGPLQRLDDLFARLFLLPHLSEVAIEVLPPFGR